VLVREAIIRPLQQEGNTGVGAKTFRKQSTRCCMMQWQNNKNKIALAAIKSCHSQSEKYLLLIVDIWLP
jgi:hypothetical protein